MSERSAVALSIGRIQYGATLLAVKGEAWDISGAKCIFGTWYWVAAPFVTSRDFVRKSKGNNVFYLNSPHFCTYFICLSHNSWMTVVSECSTSNRRAGHDIKYRTLKVGSFVDWELRKGWCVCVSVLQVRDNTVAFCLHFWVPQTRGRGGEAFHGALTPSERVFSSSESTLRSSFHHESPFPFL